MNLLASLTGGLRRAALAALLLALPLATFAAEPRTFATPEAAVEALFAALKANDEPALIAIMGDKHRSLIVTGDAANDAARRAEVADLLATYRSLDDSAPDRRVLLLGTKAWPLPIPLVRQGNAWRFDADQGAEEMLNRRIGRNERSAIEVLNAYVDAQREYASRDRDGDGVLQYAAKLGSTPGKQDGLYWAADAKKGEEASPFGPLIAQSAAYFSGHKAGDPYRGYHFRILTRQGKSAPGGAYSYIINGRLLAGFAMVAFPAAYGETGVMTFIVNQNGKIFEKDLGANGGAVAAKMTAFDPGAGWRATSP
ncbi:MAG: DUF2950 domain-containing protein [Burkholderiales bacterium]|nr:DUF2950 domain-containing protein [Burkholderiales bacterium]